MIGRVFDVDDVLLNVLGALVGYYLYIDLSYIKDKLPDFLKNKIFYNIIVVLLIALLVLYLWKFLRLGVFING